MAEGLKKFTLKLVTPTTEKIGWEFETQDFLEGQLRALLMAAAGSAGHEKYAFFQTQAKSKRWLTRTRTITEAQSKFMAFLSGNDSAIHPSLRSAVFRTVIAEGGEREYVAVKNEYTNSKSLDGKETCLVAMGRVHDPKLVNDFLDFQFSEKVATQDKHTGTVSLASNAKARNALWAYVKGNWQKLYDTLFTNPIVLDRYLKTSLAKFASHETGKDIADFFQDKDTRGYDRGLAEIADTVKANANYKDRDEALMLEWLQAHGYA